MFGDPPFDLSTLAILWAGGFVGGIATGGAGFAFAVVASSVWLHVVDPLRAAFIVVACSTIMQSWLIWRMRRHIEGRRLWPFVAGGVIGIPIGVRLLAHTDPATIKWWLGWFLLVFGAYAILSPRLPRISRGGRPADAAIGFIGGMLGGLGGYSGVIPTIWTQLRHWPKEVARAVYQPFILFAQLATLILISFVTFSREAVLLLLAVLPAVMLGTWAGYAIYGRLDEKRFRQSLALLLVISGAVLVF